MQSKIIGAMLLIAGTSIGGGMLGLPIATAQSGLCYASLLFIGCWALMTFTAFLTLEVSLCMPPHSNVISMAKKMLGKPGEIISWSIYLLFLYALVSAYIASGQDVFHGLLIAHGWHVSLWLCGLVFVFIFGSIVTAGVKQVDFVNRLLMITKLIMLTLLISTIFLHISPDNYAQGHYLSLLPAVTVTITSFGFSIIVPTLRDYLQNDIKKLRLALFVGSLIPLVCYIAWIIAIFGAIPRDGQYGLTHLLHDSQPMTGLLADIYHISGNSHVDLFSRLFISICVLTAFMCVSLGLSDYIADGIRREKRGGGRFIISLLTFIPPLITVMFYPHAFILFLSLAGLCCVILQALMPALMAWRCRYHFNAALDYQVFGGKLAIIIALTTAIAATAVGLYQLLG